MKNQSQEQIEIDTDFNALADKPYSYGTVPETDGRRKSERPASHYIKNMWDIHHEAARMIVLGCKNKEIAEKLGKSQVWVSQVRNSPVVKEKLTVMNAARDAGAIDLAREIRDLAPIAVIRIQEALNTGKVLDKEVSAANILKEANGVLDREVGKPTQRIDTRNVHGHFTLEDINAIKDRAKALAASSGQMSGEVNE